MLGQTDQPLWHAHDLAMLDLDGVVYISGDAVPGAPDHLAAARREGLRLAFVTNNASRPPSTVAEHLVSLGVEATTDDVVTSAQAAARVLLERLGRGGRVAVLGAEGLLTALRELDLVACDIDDEDVEALATGYGPDVVWKDLMRAAVRVRDGLWWVASNTDMTIPTSYGTAPGHGVLVDMVQRFSGVTPDVGGKPARPLLDETVRRVGGERPLMVGDRLDTDILGGRNADVPTLLVLTGVTGLGELVAATPELRPTYVSVDLGGLGQVHPQPVEVSGAWEVGGWTARVHDGALAVEGGGGADDWWRAVCCAAWDHLDSAGEPARADGLRPPSPIGSNA
jgi:HAD superfamily hydrolase (TIGR01450 family)